MDGMDDEEIMESIPSDFFLKGEKNHQNGPNMRPMLAAMVHRTNPDLVSDCTSVASGQTRDKQRVTGRERIQATREAEREERARIVEMDPEVRAAKKARITFGMLSILKTKSDVISTHLRLWAENKESFIRIHGQDTYDQKIVELLGKLPDPVQDLLAEVESAEPADALVEPHATSSDDDEDSA